MNELKFEKKYLHIKASPPNTNYKGKIVNLQWRTQQISPNQLKKGNITRNNTYQYFTVLEFPLRAYHFHNILAKNL